MTALFGSFGEFTSVGVFVSSEDCWIFQASDVVLEGTERVSHDLLAWIRDPARRAAQRVPQKVKVDATWFRRVAPIGLQLPLKPRSITRKPILLGFVAGKLRKTQDGSKGVAYPFLLREVDERILIEFSAAGPNRRSRAAS